jgi:hypothetical protein
MIPGRSCRDAHRDRRVSATIVCLLAAVLGVLVSQGRASAAVTHEFLPVPSETISKGVPPGCGTGSPACVPGPLGEPKALGFDAAHLWLADPHNQGSFNEQSRVDKFDGTSGEFSPPQLDEEQGVGGLIKGVAVGHPGAEEQVYVGAGQEGQNVLAVFGPSGKLQPEGVWTGKNTPKTAFGEVRSVAVSTNLATAGDVYVANGKIVDVFPGEMGGKEPEEERGQLLGAPEAPSTEGHFEHVEQVAVSPVNGDVFVADGEAAGCVTAGLVCVVDVFEPTPGMPGVYNFLFSIKGPPGEPFEHIGPMSVDGEGDIYVVDETTNVVDQFDSSGKFISRLPGTTEGPFKEVTSMAADPVSGNVYVGDYDKEQHSGAIDVFGPSRIVPDIMTTSSKTRVNAGPGGEGAIEATLEGTVNPLGQGPATCQFALGPTAAFGTFAGCDEAVAEGNAPVPVKATVKEELAPGTRYFFRLQASNKNGTNPGQASDNKELITPGPGIREESAVDVSSTAATLETTMDPNGAPTSYYFQYGRRTAYETQAPAAPGLGLGEAVGDVKAPPQQIQGLTPETEYHYRVVAVSQLQVQGGGVQPVSFAGPDRTFTTQGAGAQALPDGRRWELVSPPDKHGGKLEGNEGPGAIQAAADGGAVSYLSSLPTEASVKGNRGEVQVFSTRTMTGWSAQNLALPRRGPVSSLAGPEYVLLSSDLSTALVEPEGEEFNSLAPEVFPPDTERGPYIRHNSTCAIAPEGCFQPLVIGCPPAGQPCPPAVAEYADVPAGTRFGGNPEAAGGVAQERYRSAVETVAASADLVHLIVRSRVPLTKTATGEGEELYEISPASPPAQAIQLVSLIPDEATKEDVSVSHASLGDKDKNIRNAVSADGNIAVFAVESHLYLRDLASNKTLQLDLPKADCVAQAECGDGEASPQFQLASPDGKRVLFTDTQRLTRDAGRLPGKRDLYQCETQVVAGKLQCNLSDLTPAPVAKQAADVRGTVIGASEDGSWVYFVANGVLGDAAQRGASKGDCDETTGVRCNLYAYHEGAIHLIAVLAGADFQSWAGNGFFINMTARVSPDGRYLAFMSQRSLTGYDNRDALSGQPDQEVFIYHSEGSGSGSLACASCNPDGARPVGVDVGSISKTWTAASVPGWTEVRPGKAIYQTRYLSNEGRLFFNSHDALVPQDINNNEDVFQFEPIGVGGCSTASGSFHATTGGCLALISSGRAAGESTFLDASESGNDVFFLTAELLVRKDVDTAVDLYDAHVCSTEAPCSEESEPPSNCVTAEACRPAPTAQPEIFGSPSSAMFSGQGNIEAPAPKGPKPLTRAQKLARALKTCRKKHNRGLRKSCERQARRRYGSAVKRARKGNNAPEHSTSSRGGR